MKIKFGRGIMPEILRISPVLVSCFNLRSIIDRVT